jgi:hypothetical protein
VTRICLSLTAHRQPGAGKPHRAGAGTRARAHHRAALAWALGLVTATACANGPSPATPDRLAPVLALVGDAACRSDADCRTIGVGQRACGGPSRYLAWSAWRTSGHALEKAAAATRVPPVSPTGEGMMSTCQVLADPGAQCVRPAATAGQGTCQLRQRP